MSFEVENEDKDKDDILRDIKITKRRKILVVCCSIIIFIFIVIIAKFLYGLFSFFGSEGLPKGELITEAISPDRSYSIKAYLVNGGATVDYAIRGELFDNKRRTRIKNIYWNYHESSAYIDWIDNETVIINNRRLNIKTDEYDWRNDK